MCHCFNISKHITISVLFFITSVSFLVFFAGFLKIISPGHKITFLGILMHIFKNKYRQHVRNTVLAVCAKPVPVWGKRRKMRGLSRGEKLS